MLIGTGNIVTIHSHELIPHDWQSYDWTPGGQVSGNAQLSLGVVGSGHPRIASDYRVVFNPVQCLCSTRCVTSDTAAQGLGCVCSQSIYVTAGLSDYRLTASMTMDEGY